MTNERMPAGELPAYLTREIYRDLNVSAACFVHRNRQDQPAESFGSGVFVKYEDTFGILTAAHVAKALQSLPSLELGLPRVRYTLRVPQESVVYRSTPLPKRKFDKNGPDLAFVKLSPATVSYLRGPIHFVNLAFHQNRLREMRKIPLDDAFWCHVGFPAHYVRGVRSERERVVITRVRCITYLGGVEKVKKRGRFDYYDSKVVYEGQPFMPASFEGMSGGALWSIRIGRKKKRPRRLVMLDRLLSGIVFYQLADDGKVNELRSHGRASIYDYALKELILGR